MHRHFQIIQVSQKSVRYFSLTAILAKSKETGQFIRSTHLEYEKGNQTTILKMPIYVHSQRCRCSMKLTKWSLIDSLFLLKSFIILCKLTLKCSFPADLLPLVDIKSLYGGIKRGSKAVRRHVQPVMKEIQLKRSLHGNSPIMFYKLQYCYSQHS